jgi:hypothetical protein
MLAISLKYAYTIRKENTTTSSVCLVDLRRLKPSAIAERGRGALYPHLAFIFSLFPTLSFHSHHQYLKERTPTASFSMSTRMQWFFLSPQLRAQSGIIATSDFSSHLRQQRVGNVRRRRVILGRGKISYR